MFAPNRKLGQNFLENAREIKKMVGALGALSGEMMIEIGPGLGSVTQEIISTYGSKNIQIKAVEIDLRFVDKLKNMFANQDNLEIIEANILDWLPRFNSEGSGIRIIGSLPYYITSPILYEIVRMRERPLACVLLIQKEVAEKILAGTGDSIYLSVLVQTFFEVESLGTVDRSEFSPAPEVDGGILKLTKRAGSDDLDAGKYMKFLKKVFASPRKMLNKTFYEDELNRAQLDGTKRPQDYGWKEWSKAFRILV